MAEAEGSHAAAASAFLTAVPPAVLVPLLPGVRSGSLALTDHSHRPRPRSQPLHTAPRLRKKRPPLFSPCLLITSDFAGRDYSAGSVS